MFRQKVRHSDYHLSSCFFFSSLLSCLRRSHVYNFDCPNFYFSSSYRKMEPDSTRKNCFDVRFPRASTHLLVGVSGAGKTYRMIEILKLKDQLIQQGSEVKNVVFCYSVWQPCYEQLNGVVTKWINRMISNDEFIGLTKPFMHGGGGSIVILDDFLGSVGREMSEMVCVSARHYDTSLFILFQTLFPKDKFASVITRNAKFLHIHKNPRDNSQIRYLASQLYPANFQWIVKAYHKATEEPFSCFLVDLTQQCPEKLRFRSHYLPCEFPMRVWKQAGMPDIFEL